MGEKETMVPRRPTNLSQGENVAKKVKVGNPSCMALCMNFTQGLHLPEEGVENLLLVRPACQVNRTLAQAVAR